MKGRVEEIDEKNRETNNSRNYNKKVCLLLKQSAFGLIKLERTAVSVLTRTKIVTGGNEEPGLRRLGRLKTIRAIPYSLLCNVK